jgi:hypothetical protein
MIFCLLLTLGFLFFLFRFTKKFFSSLTNSNTEPNKKNGSGRTRNMLTLITPNVVDTKARQVEALTGLTTVTESKKMAMVLLSSSEVAVTGKFVDWLSMCPDFEMFKKLQREHLWLVTRIACFECGEIKARKNMRYDEASPIGDSTHLVCRGCWDFWSQGTMGDPDYRPPPWPTQPPQRGNARPLPSGNIVCKTTKRVVGRVKKYNAKGHFGHVTLYGMESAAEYGSLDPGDEVVLDNSENVSGMGQRCRQR